MRIRLAVPDNLIAQTNGEILEPVLETVTRANQAMIRAGQTPTAIEQIRHGVRWRPEPPQGFEAFDLGATVYRRGYGDCDDLAPLAAASDRVTGRDPEARAIVRQTGPGRFHALVEHADGSIEDPSRTAGMPSKHKGARPSVTRQMGDGLTVGWMPACVRGESGYACRTDLPWQGTPFQLSGLAWGRTRQQSLTQSARLAGLVAHANAHCDPSHALQVQALESLMRGINREDIRRALAQRCQNPAAILGGAEATLENLRPYLLGDAIHDDTQAVVQAAATAAGIPPNPATDKIISEIVDKITAALEQLFEPVGFHGDISSPDGMAAMKAVRQSPIVKGMMMPGGPQGSHWVPGWDDRPEEAPNWWAPLEAAMDDGVPLDDGWSILAGLAEVARRGYGLNDIATGTGSIGHDLWLRLRDLGIAAHAKKIVDVLPSMKPAFAAPVPNAVSPGSLSQSGAVTAYPTTTGMPPIIIVRF